MHEVMSAGSTGVLVGVVGIILAIVFYLRSRTRKQLAYQYEDTTLLGSPQAIFPEEVQILFASLPVPRVTASRFVIWNNGNRTIDGDDLVPSDPLRFEVPADGKILKYEFLAVSREVNAWSFKWVRPDCLEAQFDFLDPGDGINVQITHSESGSNLRFSGTIKGIPVGPQNLGNSRQGVPSSALLGHFHPRNILKGALLVAAFYGVSGLWSIPYLSPHNPEDAVVVRWAPLFFGALYAALSATLLWKLRRRYPATLAMKQPARR